jgi:glutamate decarboxylase
MLKRIEKIEDELLEPVYGSKWDINPAPKNKIPQESMRSDQAFQMIYDEMNLQGNANLNLATFVTTWMEPEAKKLMELGANYNLVDEDEYPQLKVIEERIIKMQAELFNVPSHYKPYGVTTVGSSEAIILGLLAHKWSWRKKRQEAGLDFYKPNVIFGADVHSCWEKFTRYFDVEMRIIPMEDGKYTINAEDVKPLIDENTIAVGTVIGTTFTGQIDDIGGINKMLVALKEETGQDIPIHVDAASGGFVLPFILPDFEWDFRLEQVKTINVSNHKFGLVYAGMGSLIFKDKSFLPEELPFDINYLGGSMTNYSLNFSKTSSNLLAQYYNFLRFGKAGYKHIMEAVMSNAHYLEKRLLNTGYFELLTDAKYLPVVVIKLKDAYNFTAYDISRELNQFGWIVPAYSLPANSEDVVVLRIVVKENFSHDFAQKLIVDIEKVLHDLKTEKRKSKPHQKRVSHSKTKPHAVC